MIRPSNPGRVVIVLAGVLVCCAAGAAGLADPDAGGFEEARIQVQRLDRELDAAVQSLAAAGNEPQWVAWTVPAAEPEDSICCFSDRSRGGAPGICHLESRDFHSSHRDDAVSPAGDLRVLVRLKDRGIDRVRTYSRNCKLNAGGRQVTLLQGVEPEQSVALLAGFMKDDNGRKRIDETMMAIASHAHPTADDALERFAHRDSPRQLRTRAAFWLGAARGSRGLTVLRRMLGQERDADVLEQVVFGISLSEGAGASELLIHTAKNDPRAELRKKALFWLAHRASERAVETLSEAVDDDPDAEVREHAVFALSQLSGGRGVPMLIRLAQSNRHPEVRQRAIFWLGQSGDSRALDLFEEILSD